MVTCVAAIDCFCQNNIGVNADKHQVVNWNTDCEPDPSESMSLQGKQTLFRLTFLIKEKLGSVHRSVKFLGGTNYS